MSRFSVALDELQPSQLYISRAKLQTVQYALDCGGVRSIEPIPVLRWGRSLLMTDGHSRALALCIKGHEEIPVCWESETVDVEMYGLCLAWCRQQQVFKVRDLLRKVVTHECFETLWIHRCQQALAQLRG